MTTQEFILQYRTSDVAKAALLVRQYPEVDHDFAIRQIEGWQKAQDKLPQISKIADWWYPVRLSMEQCSSELTAKYKRSIVDRLNSEALNVPQAQLNGAATPLLTDLTGGFGIDAYYMGTTDYVEQNAELCDIVAHNMALASRPIRIHNTTAEAYLASIAPRTPLPPAEDSSEPSYLLPSTFSLIYLDPARRDSHGGKVFRLEDCTPNVVELYPTLMSKCDALLLKLSPMLDITAALRSLPDAREVHVVAVRNEVKEVLILCHKKTETLEYFCVNLSSQDPVFHINGDSQLNSVALNGASQINVPQAHLNALGTYLYEPNAAIMKAGLFNEVVDKYDVVPLGINSHLFTSDTLLQDFPGRIWLVRPASKEEIKNLTQANILTRNYPLRPEEIKRKYKIKDGGSLYVIGTTITTNSHHRISQEPILLLGERVNPQSALL